MGAMAQRFAKQQLGGASSMNTVSRNQTNSRTGSAYLLLGSANTYNCAPYAG